VSVVMEKLSDLRRICASRFLCYETRC